MSYLDTNKWSYAQALGWMPQEYIPRRGPWADNHLGTTPHCPHGIVAQDYYRKGWSDFNHPSPKGRAEV